MKDDITVRLTMVQANAILFACSNTLVEPANFENGTGHERTEAPLRRSQEKIERALARATR